MKALKREDSNVQLTESVIIKRVLQGEKELYELLMRRNNQKLFRVIRSYLKDLEEIEDLMQNTYLKAYEKLFQFKHTAVFSTWLIRIGINEALARLKQKGKIYSLHDPSSSFETNPNSLMSKQKSLSPEDKIIQHEAKLVIERAIDTLDVKYKVVFVLKEVEGMSLAEIAECLDLSVSNVKVRLHRAKAILKEKLFELYSSKEVFEFGFSRCDDLVERVMGRI